ncbi:MarR family transcriptional regulator [Altererythrobacter xixiisoli]|uniref:MarR family transcriptional regulator n=2 Tax=Croceibacterium xixiisoli TaxID=1476466 RepID=A0A6I4TWE6_9SPHN|nr:MarR family transcriptional regulator [Croceibacterium xixiisoli]
MRATAGAADSPPPHPGLGGNKAALLHRLLKLTNRLMAPFSTHLQHRYRISLNEFRVLMTVGALKRTASHEVAELTGVNVMSISRAVAALEKDGRLLVEPDDANRRRKWLTLTDEGRRLYTIMRPQSEKVAEYMLSELSDGEVAQLDRLVMQLVATLEARDDDGNSLFLENTRPEDDTGQGAISD